MNRIKTNPLSRILAAPRGRILAAVSSACLAAAFALPVSALSPNGEMGEPVRSIDSADEISDWSALDNQHVLINTTSQNTYLITLKHQCHGLTWAQNVTVSMSNNTIWAGFDAIKANGLQCPIQRISIMSAQELLELDR